MAIKVYTQLRKSMASPVPNSILSVNGSRMEIDEQVLPARLVCLLPARYGHATPKQWMPFVTLAMAMGLLK